MFSKAKRFQPANFKIKSDPKVDKITKVETHALKALTNLMSTDLVKSCKQQISVSQPCSRSTSATRTDGNREINKCFVTAKVPIKTVSVGSLNKKCALKSKISKCLENDNSNRKVIEKPKICNTGRKKTNQNDVLTTKDAEIRNKNQTIKDYERHIEQLHTEIEQLRLRVDHYQHESGKLENKQIQLTQHGDFESDNRTRGNEHSPYKEEQAKIAQRKESIQIYLDKIVELENKIQVLEEETSLLRHEVLEKQLELSSMEELICIRDGLCKDLQEKLTEKETLYEDICLRLKLVKEHHELALQANESIRREYKLEMETFKTKVQDDKQLIINNMRKEHGSISRKYLENIEEMQLKMTKDKEMCLKKLEDQIKVKDEEMRAKLAQMEEKSTEQLRLCEIQFEERNRSLNDHWCNQQERLLQYEIEQLKTMLSEYEEKTALSSNEIKNLLTEKETYMHNNAKLKKQLSEMEMSLVCKANINYENEIHTLRAEIEKFKKDKCKFDISLCATRKTVNVLCKRLHDSDSEVEKLETNIKNLKNTQNSLELEVEHYKSMLQDSLVECNEYRDALVNILKSKAALAKEHSRIMEHNVTLIESLQIVEKEAYRELGNVKDELVCDVESLKQESNLQILQLREEVERKGILLIEAQTQLTQASTVATDSRALLDLAAQEITRLEVINEKLEMQVQDQAILAADLEMVQKENKELAVTVARQSSVIDQMKKEAEIITTAALKSPLGHRKQSLRFGKENNATIVNLSPLRERNH